MLFQLERARIELIISSLFRYKFVMVAAFDDFAVFENADEVGVSDG